VNALEAARATARPIARIGREPMADPATYERGAALGFDGFGFYLYGRGACLGAVDADVAAAAYVFFAPATVRPAWEAGLAVMAPDRAAAEWAGCIHAWGRQHVPADLDAARLAELAGRVVAGADVGALPLFAAWRRLPEPDDVAALAAHCMNGLRELRGGLHGLAVRAVGLAPVEAIVVHDAWMGSLFGWPEPWPDPEPFVERRRRAEDLTDELMAAPLGVLDDGERDELAVLTAQLLEAVATG
jgi:hypothetical protein